MSDIIFSVSGNVLDVAGKRLTFSHDILKAVVSGDTIVVLLDPDGPGVTSGQFHNIIGLSPSGEHRWIADLPTSQRGDRYYQISSDTPLIAYSIFSFECELDPGTGRIVRRTFYR